MTNGVRPGNRLSRRDVLKTAAAGAAGLVVAAVPGELSAEEIAPLPADATPDEALQALVQGNVRFMGGKVTSPNRTLNRLKELGKEGQTPFASVLACADSRVPVEVVFDQGFGDIFVCRAAGNIATSEIIGSLEYGTQVLGSKVLMVLGHHSCGAVAATIKGEAVPGQIGSLYPYIHPAVMQANSKDVDAVVAQNVRYQVDLLRNASPVIRTLAQQGKLKVVGGVLNFEDGRVTLLDV